MVDATAGTLRRGSTKSEAAYSAMQTPAHGALEVFCLTGREALAFHHDFCRDALFAPPQGPAWVESWTRRCNPDVLVLAMQSATATALSVPLEIVRDGQFRVARFMGGSHANGNFPALATDKAVKIGPATLNDIARTIRAARPDVDLVAMERQVKSFEGHENPFATVSSWESPNPALAVDLSSGFEGVLARASGKRKRKKHRSQTRKFEAAGGFRRITAVSRAETDRLLDAFFEMKAVRFAAMGVHNVFGDEEVRTFFRDLFAGALDGRVRPEFVLHGLEVGGVLRAVTGSSRTRSSIICEFGSIAEDDLAGASPGEFLFFENISEACTDGLSVYDFSVGDEGYKRLWCDLETWHFDLVVPVTAKGRAGVFMRRAGVAAKRFVKSNPRLWNAVKSLRRRDAAPSQSQNDDAD